MYASKLLTERSPVAKCVMTAEANMDAADSFCAVPDGTGGKELNGKPYAGNPHVRFDEGEVAPAATPRRGSLLYRVTLGTILATDSHSSFLHSFTGAGASVSVNTSSIKETRKMNTRTIHTAWRTVAMLAMAGTLALGAGAASVTIDSVTQRWPWNNKIDITYTVTDGQTLTSTGNDVYMRLVFNASIGGQSYEIDGVTNIGASANSGTHTVTWTPPADLKVKDSGCTMTATLYSADRPSGDDYMIVDLDTGVVSFEGLLHSQDLSNARYNTNDSAGTYKTGKLVLRKVPRGGPYYTKAKGAPGWTTEYDFYVGIFMVTRGQYNRLIPSKTWNYSVLDGQTSAYKPADRVAWEGLRASTLDPTEPIPALQSESGSSFLQVLNFRTGNKYGFDLPTLNMAEIANRAGTSTTYSWGNDNSQAVVTQYAQCYKAHGNSTTEVGVLLPNNWGLYDTTGNLSEFCLDDKSSGSLADLASVFTPRWANNDKRMSSNGLSFADNDFASPNYAQSDSVPSGLLNHRSFRVYCIMK